ncbi:hypothetical protein SNEBB_011467 [Seison nebaliae]|nr:hypothetical protein SNEBB_011467 [Seison nebaliae]
MKKENCILTSCFFQFNMESSSLLNGPLTTYDDNGNTIPSYTIISMAAHNLSHFAGNGELFRNPGNLTVEQSRQDRPQDRLEDEVQKSRSIQATSEQTKDPSERFMLRTSTHHHSSTSQSFMAFIGIGQWIHHSNQGGRD